LAGTGSPIISANEISYCGHGISADGPAHLDGNIISLCGIGIDLKTDCIDVINNTVVNCTDWPVKHDIKNPVELAGNGNSFTGNTYFGRYVSGSTTSYWPPHEWVVLNSEALYLPFVFDNITVADKSILRIEPGIVIKMNHSRSITVNGTLIANGTTGNEIIFTSIKDDDVDGIDVEGNGDVSPSKGDWYYIRFNDLSDDSACILDYTFVGYGGYSYGEIYCANASPTVTNSEICFSKNYGIYLSGNSNPVLSGNDYHDNNSGDVGP
jgi:hypothetical protein